MSYSRKLIGFKAKVVRTSHLQSLGQKYRWQSGLVTDIWRGCQPCRIESLTCRIWCSLQVDRVRGELNCRTPCWCQRVSWCCGNHSPPSTATGVGFRTSTVPCWGVPSRAQGMLFSFSVPSRAKGPFNLFFLSKAETDAFAENMVPLGLLALARWSPACHLFLYRAHFEVVSHSQNPSFLSTHSRQVRLGRLTSFHSAFARWD